MKVCILSDSHDNRACLEAAVREARDCGAQAILHCGDVVAPGTLEAVIPFGLPVHVIHGNNSGDLYMMGRIASRPSSRVYYYGQDAGIELHRRRIFWCTTRIMPKPWRPPETGNWCVAGMITWQVSGPSGT